MTAQQAREASQLITDRFDDVMAGPVDPRSFLTLGLDRWSAEALRAGLAMVADAGGDVGVLMEDVEDFLVYGYPYEEGRNPGLGSGDPLQAAAQGAGRLPAG
ncbi:hypothetical protein GCM10028777_02320 [Angustibacter speluncae]